MTLTPRFEQALNYACVVHAGHLRKGTSIPYVDQRGEPPSLLRVQMSVPRVVGTATK